MNTFWNIISAILFIGFFAWLSFGGLLEKNHEPIRTVDCGNAKSREECMYNLGIDPMDSGPAYPYP